MSTLTDKVSTLKIHEIKRHIFLCCDQAKPKCCSYHEGMIAWEPEFWVFMQPSTTCDLVLLDLEPVFMI